MGSQDQFMVRRQLQRVRESQARVADRIRVIQEQLARIEHAIPPAAQYEARGGACMAAGLRIWCLQYVKAPPPKLQAELQHELAALQSEIANLQLRERSLAHRFKLRQQADHTSQEFADRLKETLREAEKAGELPVNQMAELLEQSEAALANHIDILRADPSPENIFAVLKNTEVPLSLGGGAPAGKASEAFRAAGEAAEVLLHRAQRDFDKVPSVGNFDRLLGRARLAQVLGTGDDALAPPPQFVPVHKTHTVAPGESLSGIARHYYGKDSYWPYIYMENFTKLDPNKLPAGATLTIP
jgi:LysM domain